MKSLIFQSDFSDSFTYRKLTSFLWLIGMFRYCYRAGSKVLCNRVQIKKQDLIAELLNPVLEYEISGK